MLKNRVKLQMGSGFFAFLHFHDQKASIIFNFLRKHTLKEITGEKTPLFLRESF
jgi:hypothetical protein